MSVETRTDSISYADDGLTAFLRVRPRLLGIASRIVRRASEAEDIVQEVWVRWQTTDRAVVRDASAFLVTTTTRLSINAIQSARVRRETVVDPQTRDTVDARADSGAQAETVELAKEAIRILQQAVPPAQRAAFVLREAFDYSYREIARALGIEEANARQLVTRARQHVGRRHPIAAGATEPCLADAFIGAARRGDLSGLEGLFRSELAQRAAQWDVWGPCAARTRCGGGRPQGRRVTPASII